MAGFGGFGQIVGGLMTGAGDAMVSQGKREREAAIRMMEQEHGAMLRSEENRRNSEQRHTYDMEERNFSADRDDKRAQRSDAAAERRIGLQGAETRKSAAYNKSLDADDVTHYDTDDSGEVVGFTRKGKAIKSGTKTTTGLSKSDKELLARIEPQFSRKETERNEDGQVVGTSTSIDSSGMAQRLNEIGRPDLAKLYGGGKAAAPRQQQGGGQAAAKLPQGVDRQQVLEQAKAAIAAGKDRNAVIKRVQSYGIDASGL